MIGSLNVYDRFLAPEDFAAWRDLARHLDFATVQHPRDGHLYQNVGLLPVGWTLVPAIGYVIDQPRVEKRLEFLRLGEPQDGAGNIHCDDGDAQLASVYYLNSSAELRDQPTGTAFWSHKWLKSDRLPLGAEPEVVDFINRDRTDESKWELEFVLPAKENRLIVYPTVMFHSRWPLEPKAGRLVHVSFFNVR